MTWQDYSSVMIGLGFAMINNIMGGIEVGNLGLRDARVQT